MRVRSTGRPRWWFTTLALWLAAIPLYAWAGDSGVHQIDLQPYLCALELQQPNNDPPAGVDFVTDNEVLVYTVCRVNTTLSTRTAAGPEASDPNHLKAVPPRCEHRKRDSEFRLAYPWQGGHGTGYTPGRVAGTDR